MCLKKRISIIFFLLLCVFSIFPDKIAFKYQKGIKYKIITTSSVDLYVNNQYDFTLETLYKISIDVTDIKDKSGYLSGIFRTSEKSSAEDAIYQQIENEIAVSYWRDELGNYTTSTRIQRLPQVRDVPLFPEKVLSVGDSWTAKGKEIFDISEFGINELIVIPLDVSYVYMKNETIDDVKCAVFRIYYTFNLSLAKYAKLKPGIPIKIIGYSNTIYNFDIKNGREYNYEDTFSLMYLYLNGDVDELKGKSRGDVIEGAKLDKDQMIKEIEAIIKEEEIKDTAVQKDEDGVKLILEDINFLPESDILVPAEQEKLKKIGKILSKYPERDFFVGGHTALAGTENGRQLLSEKRAKAVGEFLLSLGICKDTQLTFRGFGARIPLGDNSTPEGMKKNRRVEIKILEN